MEYIITKLFKEGKLMKKIIALVLVFSLVFALAACGGGGDSEPVGGDGPADEGKVYKMNVSFAAPEFSNPGITAAFERIQEASNGRIEFTYYYSWSLSSVPTVIDDLNSGIVDIAAVPVTEHMNLFPYTNLVTYTPFLGLPGTMAAGDFFHELYHENEAIQEEYEKAGVVYWTNYPLPPYNIYTTKDFAIKTPDDLNGLKLISSSALMQQFIDSHGGAVVNAPVTEYATSLNTSVVDGVINHANVLAAFGALDFVNGATAFGDSGTALAILTMCISENTWNDLPEDLQQLFLDEADNLRHDQGAWDIENGQKNLASIEEKGGTVTYLTEEEMKVWQDAFAEMLEDYIAELNANGATEAQNIYDQLMKKIANY
jgi:TRAP-type C4-dicarboxylate transport system substrate-binding protein